MQDDQKWAGNGWTQYQKLVLAELERHSDMLEKIKAEITVLNIESVKMETKHRIMSAFYGFAGSLLIGSVGLIYELMRHA